MWDPLGGWSKAGTLPSTLHCPHTACPTTHLNTAVLVKAMQNVAETFFLISGEFCFSPIMKHWTELLQSNKQCMQCQQSGAIPVWWCMWCSKLLKCGGVVMVQQLQVSDHRPAEPLQGTT